MQDIIKDCEVDRLKVILSFCGGQIFTFPPFVLNGGLGFFFYLSFCGAEVFVLLVKAAFYIHRFLLEFCEPYPSSFFDEASWDCKFG